MSSPDLQDILSALRTPLSAEAAALRLGCPAAVLKGLFRQLQARGLVAPAEPGVGVCKSGCGMCSMQNFCPSSETSPVADVQATASETWRLTELGETQLATALD